MHSLLPASGPHSQHKKFEVHMVTYDAITYGVLTSNNPALHGTSVVEVTAPTVGSLALGYPLPH
jgi:hypothetical protein